MRLILVLLLFAFASPSFAQTKLGEDENLPMVVKGKSRSGNDAVLADVQYSLSDNSFGTFQAPSTGAGSAPSYDQLFIPSGLLGTITITVTAKNSKDEVTTGTIDVEIVVGAAQTIEITPLPAISKG